MNKGNKGWFGDRFKHSLASRGIRTITENTTLYRGSNGPELDEGHWMGTWLSHIEKIAKGYGNKTYIFEPKEDIVLLDVLDNDDDKEVYEKKFIRRYPEQETYLNQGGDFSELWMFPPDEFVKMLKLKGYDGFIYGSDIFVINYDKLKFKEVIDE